MDSCSARYTLRVFRIGRDLAYTVLSDCGANGALFFFLCCVAWTWVFRAKITGPTTETVWVKIGHQTQLSSRVFAKGAAEVCYVITANECVSAGTFVLRVFSAFDPLEKERLQYADDAYTRTYMRWCIMRTYKSRRTSFRTQDSLQAILHSCHHLLACELQVCLIVIPIYICHSTINCKWIHKKVSTSTT